MIKIIKIQNFDVYGPQCNTINIRGRIVICGGSNKMKRCIYVCNCFVERNLSELYMRELEEHYDVYTIDNNELKHISDIKYDSDNGEITEHISTKYPSVTHLAAEIREKRCFAESILEKIKSSDIILVFIESTLYTYPETFADIGIATALGKPMVLFDNSRQLNSIVRADVDPTYKNFSQYHGGNRIISNVPHFWAKNIVHTSSWHETKKVINSIVLLLCQQEDQSFSSEES